MRTCLRWAPVHSAQSLTPITPCHIPITKKPIPSPAVAVAKLLHTPAYTQQLVRARGMLSGDVQPPMAISTLPPEAARPTQRCVTPCGATGCSPRSCPDAPGRLRAPQLAALPAKPHTDSCRTTQQVKPCPLRKKVVLLCRA